MNAGTEPRARAGLYRLLTWLAPSFPTGAFSYSHGLEAAAAGGAIRGRASLETWIAAILENGSGRIDVAILGDAYAAALSGDLAALDAVNRRGLAFRGTAELALESSQQGGSFHRAWSAAWTVSGDPLTAGREKESSTASRSSIPVAAGGHTRAFSPSLPHIPSSHKPGEGDGMGPFSIGVCLPAAFGAAAADAGIPLEDALLGYLQASAANLMSAGLRLGLIGQTDGQRILAALEKGIADAVDAARDRDPADFGSATFAVDLASMAHETQYSRLFRS